MSESEATKGSHQNSKDQAGTMRPAAAFSSSPLSEARSEHEIDILETTRQIEQVTDQNVKGDGRQEHFRSTSPLSSAQPTPADEGPASDVENPVYECHHCTKPYASEKSLKRHLNDKKTKCFKSRHVIPGNSQWSCPRCHTSMCKKFSVERHIKDSCWKICDQCIESDSQECDASYKDGDCTTCVEAHKTCTKHSEELEGYEPELVTVTSAEPNNAERRLRLATNAATNQKQRVVRQKRPARRSPEMSPRSKPKRKSRARKTADEDGHHFIQETMDAYQPEPLQGLGIKLGQGHSGSRPLPPTVPSHPQDNHARNTVRSLLPPFEERASGIPGAYQLQNERYPAQHRGLAAGHGEQHLSRMPPPTSNAFNASRSSQYIPTAELLRRQRESIARLQMATQSGSNYALGPQYSACVSDMRSGLHTGQPDWPQQPYAYTQNNARASLPNNFQVQQNRPVDFANNDGHSAFGFGAPNLQAPSRQSSVEHAASNNLILPHASGYASRVTSRHSSIFGGQLSAPGSRVQSCQPSRQSSPEKLASRPGTLNDTDVNPRLIVKLPLPRELKTDLTLAAAAETQTSKEGLLRLRIHSNTYDPNGTPIFSILSIHRTEPFGPRLDYYCQARKKRFNTDYKFVFKYPAPTATNPHRKRYYDIAWITKPSMLRDKEYPGSALKDGDTIWVLQRSASSDDDAETIGTQLDIQRINIQNGEIFQDPGVMDMWYKNNEHTLAAANNEVAELKNHVAALQQVLEKRDVDLQQLAFRNAQILHDQTRLLHENGQMRRALMPGQNVMVPQQHMQLPSSDSQMMGSTMAAQFQLNPNDPDVLQFRSRQRAQAPFQAMDQTPGHQSMYATANHGVFPGAQLRSNGPPMGIFSAPIARGHRRSAPSRDDMDVDVDEDEDEDAEGEDEE